jgi:hypothetical protein
MRKGKHRGTEAQRIGRHGCNEKEQDRQDRLRRQDKKKNMLFRRTKRVF